MGFLSETTYARNHGATAMMMHAANRSMHRLSHEGRANAAYPLHGSNALSRCVLTHKPMSVLTPEQQQYHHTSFQPQSPPQAVARYTEVIHQQLNDMYMQEDAYVPSCFDRGSSTKPCS